MADSENSCFAGLICLSTLSAFFRYAVGIVRLQAGLASILLMSEIAFADFMPIGF